MPLARRGNRGGFMKRMAWVLLAMGLASGCRRGLPGPFPIRECRTSETPRSCPAPLCPPGTICNIGGPQGTYLEGDGLERLHFMMAGGVPPSFPPPPASLLATEKVCGDDVEPTLRVVSCEKSGSAARCLVDVESGED